MHFILVINIINTFLIRISFKNKWEEWDSNPRPEGLEPPAITGYAISPKSSWRDSNSRYPPYKGGDMAACLHERTTISSIE